VFSPRPRLAFTLYLVACAAFVAGLVTGTRVHPATPGPLWTEYATRAMAAAACLASVALVIHTELRSRRDERMRAERRRADDRRDRVIDTLWAALERHGGRAAVAETATELVDDLEAETAARREAN
jgi:hypothetical protein